MVLSTVVPTSFTAVDSLDKMRFRFIAGHLRLSLRKQTQGGEGWHLAICFYCSALNWDHGLVDCGTNILHGCWLFRQNEIQVYCRASLTIIAGNRHRGEEWRLAIWFDCSVLNWGLWSCRLWYQHPSWLLTLWTKWDSGLLWGIFDIAGGTDTGGRVKSCHLIWLLSIKLGSWSCRLW